MTTYKIMHLIGDGISKEVSNQGIKILKTIEQVTKYKFEIKENPLGYSSYKKFGIPLTDRTVHDCRNSDAIILGAVGDPKGDHLAKEKKPEYGLLQLRKQLNLYCNIRPIKTFGDINNNIFIKEHTKNIDFVIIRELLEDVYMQNNELTHDRALDRMIYNRETIENILHYAFTLAKKNKKKLTIVDKANVLACSQLWRNTSNDIKIYYPSVELSYQYIDSMAWKILKEPLAFDVIVTSNLFGDILSDECAIFSSSLGLLPSASINKNNSLGLYEPVSGSAPDIAHKNIANPIGMILSVGMMFKYQFKLPYITNIIENSVLKTLEQNYKTADICNNDPNNKDILIGTEEMGDKICENMMPFFNK